MTKAVAREALTRVRRCVIKIGSALIASLEIVRRISSGQLMPDYPGGFPWPPI